ncbi:hypothetical protein DUI87_13176 [Hirundo rustica rustica]|uniref:Uncharacterized protein n=1 Tax=Hirundo rustica rustica TaxID=333673 RepID=A0A3M0KAY9_HIRRU|nr:hypothetical protein DUI87_13176 [Hirundo rustica rustica]
MRQCTLSKCAEDTKLGAVSDRPEGHAAIQRDFDRLDKEADRNPMKFKKCKIWPLGRDNSRHQNMLEAAQFESRLSEKDMEGLLNTSLNLSL